MHIHGIICIDFEGWGYCLRCGELLGHVANWVATENTYVDQHTWLELVLPYHPPEDCQLLPEVSSSTPCLPGM